MLKSNIQIEAKNQVNENIGEHIGVELGIKMIKDHYDKFGEGNAQFVGKKILENILSQPNCIGINIYKALNEKGQKTYVLVGIDENAKPILDKSEINISGQLIKSEGIVADRSKVVQGWFDFESF